MREDRGFCNPVKQERVDSPNCRGRGLLRCLDECIMRYGLIFSNFMKSLTKRYSTGLLCLAVLCAFLTGCASAELYTLREQAIAEYQKGNWQQARELFDEALSYGNGEVAEAEFDILKYRAECELRCHDFEAAEKTYGILLELDPSGENKELFAELENEFAKIQQINDAFALMESGNYKEAYEAMDAFAGLGGDQAEAEAWFNKAVCAEYLGNWEEAEELFRDYLAVYPEDEEAQKEYRFLKTR